ncbi:hypothetical protein SLEP1_g37514 [Rubroshorea leprosula]|uniref:RING-type E3 ubiquitin transferase n=1 Tax=Rubroshorea leprosula TaxID=152421 RepID=A0AAV5KV83_9ROSI|nr:hypothetical protein SLEP1_g37514 [Rubroshorea leprosula]
MEDHGMTMALLEPTAPQISIGPQEQPSSTEVSTAQLISAHKYQRSVGLEGEDNVCIVCLAEYGKGEEMRTLAECIHIMRRALICGSFHIQTALSAALTPLICCQSLQCFAMDQIPVLQGHSLLCYRVSSYILSTSDNHNFPGNQNLVSR